MSFLVLSIFTLILPGALLLYLSAAKTSGLILSLVWSWMYLVFGCLLGAIFGIATKDISWLLYGGILLLFVAALLKYRKEPKVPPIRIRMDVLLGGAIVFVVYTLYHFSVGTYLEIPADVYSHLDKLKFEFDSIENGKTLFGKSLNDVFDNSKIWYGVYAYLVFQSGYRIEQAYPYISYLNSTLFLIAVYCVALWTFRDIRENTITKVAIAVCASAFFLTYFGVNVFSYVRYYAIAPTICAFLIFLSAVIYANDIQRDKIGWMKGFFLIAAILVATTLIHLQETVFVLAMVWAMSAVGLARERTVNGTEWHLLNCRAGSAKWNRIICMGGITVLVVAWTAAYMFVNRTMPREPWIVSLTEYVPFVRNLFILNPNYQFYQVLSVWGYLVYVLFALNYRQLRNNVFILSGMAIPLVTVLNPFFVDFYLRFQDPYTLYRMLYMVPLPFVGAYIFVKYLRALCFQDGFVRKTGAAVVVICMIGALIPFDTIYAENVYSRMYTLAPTDSKNHPEYWGDLIDQLAGLDESDILTDPVTGYVLNGITKHHVRTRKFHKVWFELDDQSYEDDRDMFEKYDGYILIINMRGGGLSEVGRLSRHWSERVLETGRYYSEGLIRFVKNNPSMFVTIWNDRDISMYRIEYRNS